MLKLKRCILLCILFSLHLFAEPHISITPDSLIDSLYTGGISTQVLTISNTGDEELLFYIHIRTSYALQFDGSNDYVEVDNHLTLNPVPCMSVEAWLYPFYWGGNPRVLQKGMADNQYILEGESSNHLEFVINNQSYSLEINLPPLNTWTHVAATYGGDTSRIYINGILQNQMYIGGYINVTNDPFYIGNKYAGAPPQDAFDGIIDEVRLWHCARTQSQIQLNMYRELTGNEPDLMGYWTFNEGAGDIAFDYSPNSNDGFISGAVWVDSIPLSLSWFSIYPESGIVPADSSMSVEVTMDAFGLPGGDYNDNILIISNDPNQPEITIPIHLHVTSAPDIHVSEDTLDFGIVQIGNSRTLPLLITNNGVEVLAVTDIISDNDDFTVDTHTFYLDPQENQEVQVTFTPSTAGVHLATLTITSNDPDEPVVFVMLIGAGMTGIQEENKGTITSKFGPTLFSGPLHLPDDMEYKVFDITGRQIHTLNPAPGIYFIQLDEKIVYKVIKVQ